MGRLLTSFPRSLLAPKHPCWVGSLEADTEMELVMQGLYWDQLSGREGQEAGWGQEGLAKPQPTLQRAYAPVRVAHIGPTYLSLWTWAT